MPIAVFISHSSRDSSLARLIVGLLRSAFNLRADQIRCSSLDGYRLPAGAQVGPTIRREVADAGVLLGIVSQRSFGSAYVLFELGARWGGEKPLIPVLAPGTDAAVLSGPMDDLNALRCDQPGQLHQLLHDIGRTLGLPTPAAAEYQGELDELLARAPELAKQATLDAVTTTATEHEPDQGLRQAAELMELLLVVSDAALDTTTVRRYHSWLRPFVAVDSAAEQAITGASKEEPAWLELDPIDRDLARDLAVSVQLLDHDVEFYRGNDLRRLPLANLPKFADALVFPDQTYDNDDLRAGVAASMRVALQLGQRVSLPIPLTELPDSFHLREFARSQADHPLADAIDAVRANCTVRQLRAAIGRLEDWCREQGVGNPDDTPSFVSRALGTES